MGWQHSPPPNYSEYPAIMRDHGSTTLGHRGFSPVDIIQFGPFQTACVQLVDAVEEVDFIPSSKYVQVDTNDSAGCTDEPWWWLSPSGTLVPSFCSWVKYIHHCRRLGIPGPQNVTSVHEEVSTYEGSAVAKSCLWLILVWSWWVNGCHALENKGDGMLRSNVLTKMDMGDSTTTTRFHPSGAKIVLNPGAMTYSRYSGHINAHIFFSASFAWMVLNPSWCTCNNYDNSSKHSYVCYI